MKSGKKYAEIKVSIEEKKIGRRGNIRYSRTAPTLTATLILRLLHWNIPSTACALRKICLAQHK